MASHLSHISEPLQLQELRDVFSDHGLRSTRQREVVYQVLMACKSHPSADELLTLVHGTDPEVSQATIYNTLDAFVDCGLARRIPSPISGGACRYDADIAEHVHLVLQDGRVLDVPTDLSEQILDAVPTSVLDELTKRTGIELSGIKIELMGHNPHNAST